MWKRLSKTPRTPPRVPDGVRIYAVGDLHGRVDLLETMLKLIDFDCSRFPIPRPIVVFLGDYIDRGPASRDVLDRLIARSRSAEIVFLKGNHEVFLSDFLRKPSVLEEWRRYGGLETLVSYGLKPSINPSFAELVELGHAFAKSFPDDHRQFLATLTPSFSCGDFYFVHAGIRPGVRLRDQREADLLWIRDDFLLCEERFEKFVVHGHTPVAEPDIRSNRVNIDTGAVQTGRLTCLIIEGSKTLYYTTEAITSDGHLEPPSSMVLVPPSRSSLKPIRAILD